MRGIALVAATLLSCGASFAEDLDLANYLMPACRSLVAAVNYDQAAFLMGRCVGTVETIAAHVDVCSPPGVTSGSVVVKYIDDRPERMHENFRRLALEALQSAWPCKK